MVGGDHSGHVHTADVVAEEQQKVMKSLVAVIGIYMFFVFESVMSMWRKHKVSWIKIDETVVCI